MTLSANFSDFEPGWNDGSVLAKVEVPRLHLATVSEETLAAVDTAGSTTQAATAVTLGMNIAMSGAMAQVWGMINGLQIITQLPLFAV